MILFMQFLVSALLTCQLTVVSYRFQHICTRYRRARSQTIVEDGDYISTLMCSYCSLFSLSPLKRTNSHRFGPFLPFHVFWKDNFRGFILKSVIPRTAQQLLPPYQAGNAFANSLQETVIMKFGLLSSLALLPHSIRVYAQSCTNVTTEDGWQGIASISVSCPLSSLPVSIPLANVRSVLCLHGHILQLWQW